MHFGLLVSLACLGLVACDCPVLPCIDNVKSFQSYQDAMPLKSEFSEYCTKNQEMLTCSEQYPFLCDEPIADAQVHIAFRMSKMMCDSTDVDYYLDGLQDDVCANGDQMYRARLTQAFKQCARMMKGLKSSGRFSKCQITEKGTGCLADRARRTCGSQFTNFYTKMFEGADCDVQTSVLNQILAAYS